MKRFIVLTMLFSVGSGWADMGISECQGQSWVTGGTKVSSILLGTGDCAVTVLPSNCNLNFREYLFSSSGMLMVFISTDGPESTSTGSRSYFLFPRKRGLNIDLPRNGASLAVQLPSGGRAVFSTADATLQSVDGAILAQDPGLSLKNYGGVEFTSYSGILLDTGWALGDTAFANPTRKSLFRDAKGAYCAVANTEIFNYAGDSSLRYGTDAELASFLKTRCPNLDLSPLSAN